jgi:hypothetical protein
MGTTVLLRSRSARALAVATVAVALVGLVSALVDGLDVVLDYGAPLLAIGLLGWAAFWMPYVEISDGEVVVRNTLRTVHVPWPAIESVEGRYGLRLVTAYGSVTAWAASAPGGRQRARVEQSESAALVEARLAELRAAGYLDERRLERPRLRTAWHRPIIAALVLLAVATVVLPLLT